MADRIFKDIRYYESTWENVAGNSLPGDFGDISLKTEDSPYIGQRIARKLNELKYSLGEPDHLYINFTTTLQADEWHLSTRNVEKWIQYINYGIDPKRLHSLSEADKNNFIKKTTIKILKNISTPQQLPSVELVEQLIEEQGTALKIAYKTKETNAYKIDIFYQINVENAGTRAVVEYTDKKENTRLGKTFPLNLFGDIYSLVDSISFVKGKIILKPKKSLTASYICNDYKTPIELDLATFEKID